VARTSRDGEVPSLRENALYGRIVYLTPNDNSVWIAPPEQVAEAGILTAATSEELRAAVKAETAAIIIDRDWMADIEPAWARQMLADGKVVVGARLNISGLTTLLGVGAVTGASDGYPSSRLFYSLFSQPSCANHDGRVEWGAAADYLDRNQRGQFRLLIARLVQHSQNQCVDFLATDSNLDSQP